MPSIAIAARSAADAIVTSSPDILGGRRVFRGTRVPIEILFENLADGMSLDEILDEYPTLDRADAETAIRLAPLLFVGPARSSPSNSA